MTALNFPDSPTNGEVYEGYIYDSSDSVWNRLPEAPGINLENLGNVTITSVATDEVLAYDGSNWVNAAAGGGFTASTTITATDAAWPVPTLASPIVKVTVIGGGGGGGAWITNNGATGGTTTFDAGGAGTVTATGGTGGRKGDLSATGRAGKAGFASENAGTGGMQSNSTDHRNQAENGQGGAVTTAYLDLTGITTVNVTIGAGGAGGAAGQVAGGAGGRGEVIVEYVAG